MTFEYDFRNRLTRVTNGLGQEVGAYSYDAFNRRTAKTVAGSTLETTWPGRQAIEEYRDGQLGQRRIFGAGLDEVVEMASDLSGDGTLDVTHVPLYDSIGNLAVMTTAAGQPVERYQYSPFGERTILVDSTPPRVEQVRLVGAELWVEVSEAVSGEALVDALQAGTLTLTDTVAATEVSISVDQPIDTGRQAWQRIVVLPEEPAPVAGTQVQLTLPPEALVDTFLNVPSAPFELTFDWPANDAVLFDDTPPAVEQVVVREGFLDIELSETPDLATATTSILVDGATLTWTLQADGYTLRSDTAIPAGSHSLEIGAGLTDLQGQPLVSPETFGFASGTSAADLLVHQAPDPRVTSTSAVGNRLGFQGRPVDAETGLLYLRNRYYDPELGRFITPDPLGYVDGPSMYGFAGYSPVNFGDPLGLYVGETDASKLQAALAEKARQSRIQAHRAELARIQREIQVRQATVDFLEAHRGLDPVEKRMGLAQHLRSEGLAPGPARVSHQEAARLLGPLPCDGTREVLCHFEGTGHHARWMEFATLTATELAMGGLVSASYAAVPRPWISRASVPRGTSGRYLEAGPGAAVRGEIFRHAWIKRDLFSELQRLAGAQDLAKFKAALKKGIVGPQGQSGIKILREPHLGYTHELKIGGSANRLLGTIDEHGVLVFDRFVRGGLHSG